MDRFIVYVECTQQKLDYYLKSNMDRFIALELKSRFASLGTFKIQYG